MEISLIKLFHYYINAAVDSDYVVEVETPQCGYSFFFKLTLNKISTVNTPSKRHFLLEMIISFVIIVFLQKIK